MNKDKELEEAIKTLKIIANKSDQPFKFAIKTVLNYINILEKATDNKYCYVAGGRTLYSRLKELKKEDLIKAYLRLRNEINQYIKENSVPKKKIEEIIQNKSVSMFEGNAEYPNNAEEIKLVEYIKTDDLKELIK